MNKRIDKNCARCIRGDSLKLFLASHLFFLHEIQLSSKCAHMITRSPNLNISSTGIKRKKINLKD